MIILAHIVATSGLLKKGTNMTGTADRSGPCRSTTSLEGAWDSHAISEPPKRTTCQPRETAMNDPTHPARSKQSSLGLIAC